jgi:hypothetical protein
VPKYTYNGVLGCVASWSLSSIMVLSRDETEKTLCCRYLFQFSYINVSIAALFRGSALSDAKFARSNKGSSFRTSSGRSVSIFIADLLARLRSFAGLVVTNHAFSGLFYFIMHSSSLKLIYFYQPQYSIKIAGCNSH